MKNSTWWADAIQRGEEKEEQMETLLEEEAD